MLEVYEILPRTLDENANVPVQKMLSLDDGRNQPLFFLSGCRILKACGPVPDPSAARAVRILKPPAENPPIAGAGSHVSDGVISLCWIHCVSNMLISQ